MSVIFEWLDNYQINHQLIDEQHKQLFVLAHQIVESDGDVEKLKGSIMDLYAYTRVHFRAEEGLMKKSDYPKKTEHIAMHDNMLSMLNDLSLNLKPDSTIIKKLQIFMMEWLLVHIQTEDVKLAKYL